MYFCLITYARHPSWRSIGLPPITILSKARKFTNLSPFSLFSPSYSMWSYDIFIPCCAFWLWRLGLQLRWSGYFLGTSPRSTAASHKTPPYSLLSLVDTQHWITFIMIPSFVLRDALMILSPWDSHPTSAFRALLDNTSATVGSFWVHTCNYKPHRILDSSWQSETICQSLLRPVIWNVIFNNLLSKVICSPRSLEFLYLLRGIE